MATSFLNIFQQANDEAPLVFFCLFGGMAGVTITVLLIAIRIVPEYARMAIFRMGRYLGTRGPGLIILMPFLDRGIQVDLREKTENINGELTTQDNARLRVEMLLQYKIVNPDASVLQVANVTKAVREAAENRMKTVIGNLSYADVIHDRVMIEAEVKNRLAEALKQWGCQVISVEFLDIHRN